MKNNLILSMVVVIIIAVAAIAIYGAINGQIRKAELIRLEREQATQVLTDEEIAELQRIIDIKITFVKEIYINIKPSTNYKKDLYWCFQVQDKYDFEGLQKRFGLEDTELDYENDWYIISLGRELKQLTYRKSNYRSQLGGFILNPKFDMDNYEGHKAYIYKMGEKVIMLPADFFDKDFKINLANRGKVD